jgi:hypothetical protein
VVSLWKAGWAGRPVKSRPTLIGVTLFPATGICHQWLCMPLMLPAGSLMSQFVD